MATAAVQMPQAPPRTAAKQLPQPPQQQPMQQAQLEPSEPEQSAVAQQFIDLPEEERKLLQRLFKKLGTYPPRVLAQTLAQINYLGLIKLDGNGYGAEICHIADMLRTHKGFVNIDLSENKIPPAGASSLSQMLKENKVLEVAKFDRNEFEDEGVVFFAEALRVNKTLRSLSIMDCKFTVRGFKVLCDALKENKSLLTLHISGNILGDDGATMLANCLTINRSLKYISCDDCMISDVGALALYQVMQRNQGVIVYCTRFNQILDTTLLGKIETLVKKRREEFLKHDKERRKLAQSNVKIQQKKLNDMENQMSTKLKKIDQKEKELETVKEKLKSEAVAEAKSGVLARSSSGSRLSRKKAPNDVWTMVVGSDGCGEAELLQSFAAMVPQSSGGDGPEGKFVSGDVGTGKHMVHLALHHYSGSSKMSRARHLGYMSADMVIFLFAMNDSMSFDDIEAEFAADAIYANTMKEKESSFYVVGYNADKRSNPLSSEDVSTEKARALAAKLKAKGYFEVGANPPAEFRQLLDMVIKDATKTK